MVKETETKRVVRTARDGRLVIPSEFRDALGLNGDTVLEITLVEGELRIKPAGEAEPEVGSPWLKELYDYFAPARQEAIDKGYTDEEINAWIDQAVAEVRAEQRAKRD